jgi:hypothetical protein
VHSLCLLAAAWIASFSPMVTSSESLGPRGVSAERMIYWSGARRGEHNRITRRITGWGSTPSLLNSNISVNLHKSGTMAQPHPHILRRGGVSVR